MPAKIPARTLCSALANGEQTGIKAQAREHPRFKRLCISFAQQLHRFDMRLKLGLLRESAELDKASIKEAAVVQAQRHKHDIKQASSVDHTRDSQSTDRESPSSQSRVKSKPRIRPLSETKAIDRGANFISEAFLFVVAGSLILYESLRSRRRETNRREDVADRLSELEESQKRAIVAVEEMKHWVTRRSALDEPEASRRIEGPESTASRFIQKPATPTKE